MAKKKSEAYKAFQELIEKYKKQNPPKYEKKKAELEAKLAKLEEGGEEVEE